MKREMKKQLCAAGFSNQQALLFLLISFPLGLIGIGLILTTMVQSPTETIVGEQSINQPSQTATTESSSASDETPDTQVEDSRDEATKIASMQEQDASFNTPADIVSNDSKIDLAIDVVQKWVSTFTMLDANETRQYMTGEAERMYDPLFFEQFSRVNVSELKVESISGSFVNLNGVMTFVYLDGSTQRETRSFTVFSNGQRAEVTNSEFIKVIKTRS